MATSRYAKKKAFAVVTAFCGHDSGESQYCWLIVITQAIDDAMAAQKAACTVAVEALKADCRDGNLAPEEVRIALRDAMVEGEGKGQ